MTGEFFNEPTKIEVFPAKHYIAQEDQLKKSIQDIEDELEERLKYFKENGNFWKRSELNNELDMTWKCCARLVIAQVSKIIHAIWISVPQGQPPWTLIDYLPSDYLLVLDESHMTVPQIRGMYSGDRSRKGTLVEYGFRLPSAMDNRPLTFEEFETHMGYHHVTPQRHRLLLK